MATENKTAIKIEEVVQKANKGEALSKEEEMVLLQAEGAIDGYANTPAVVPPAEEKKEPEKKEEISVTEEDRKTHEGKSDQEIIEIKKAEAEKKPEKKEPEKKEEAGDQIFLRLETELAKPEGQENLEGLSKEARAYFYQMRKDRKARQDAERDRDSAKFELIKIKAKPEAPKKEEEEEDPLKELKDKDPTDFISVGDVLKIVEGIAKTPAAKDTDKPKGKDAVSKRFFVMCDNEARNAHKEDYDIVMELTGEIIDKNEQYQMKVAEAWANGENPAEVMYNIIKGDPEFAKLAPAAEIRFKAKENAAKKPETEKKPGKTPEELAKEKEAQAAQEALEKNAAKPKTTAHTSSPGDKPAAELTLEEITNMTDKEFAALPKKIREAYIQKYGA